MFKDTQHPYRCPGIGLEMVGVLVLGIRTYRAGAALLPARFGGG